MRGALSTALPLFIRQQRAAGGIGGDARDKEATESDLPRPAQRRMTSHRRQGGKREWRGLERVRCAGCAGGGAHGANLMARIIFGPSWARPADCWDSSARMGGA